MPKKGANPNKLDNIAVEHCLVLEALGGDKFKVQMPNDHILTCYLSGKLRKHFIRIIPFDVVRIELSPHDVMNNGRIVFREKNAGK